MVEFGDELIIESYQIPWLIWIQLLVMILLIVLLLFGFTVFTSEPSTSSAAALPSIGHDAAPPTHVNNPTSSSSRIIRVEDQRARRDAGTSGGLITEDNWGGEESPLKDSIEMNIFRHPHHPCSYIGLAKQALFKCFGLDSSSESSSNRQHEKRE